eukprot:99332_1
MGVQGLWKLLEQSGTQIEIESLAGRKLAVDASLWMMQFVKAMRDSEGQMIPNAHILGLFHRICKLLFFKIRPVFVFDGPAPNLKRRTLASRRQRRDQHDSDLRRTAERILMNRMKLKSIEEFRRKLKKNEDFETKSTEQKTDVPPREELNPKTDTISDENEELLDESDSGGGGFLVEASENAVKPGKQEAEENQPLDSSSSDSGEDYIDLPEDLSTLDPETIASLPISIQGEILQAREFAVREANRPKFMSLSSSPSKLSSLQLDQFLRRSKEKRQIDEIRQRKHGSAEQATKRIASEGGLEYFLYKKQSKLNSNDAQPPEESRQLVDETWMCLRCRCKNEIKHKTCDLCDTPREIKQGGHVSESSRSSQIEPPTLGSNCSSLKSEAVDDSWACCACTLKNAREALKCRICDTAKDGSRFPDDQLSLSVNITQRDPADDIFDSLFSPKAQQHNHETNKRKVSNPKQNLVNFLEESVGNRLSSSGEDSDRDALFESDGSCPPKYEMYSGAVEIHSGIYSKSEIHSGTGLKSEIHSVTCSKSEIHSETLSESKSDRINESMEARLNADRSILDHSESRSVPPHFDDLANIRNTRRNFFRIAHLQRIEHERTLLKLTSPAKSTSSQMQIEPSDIIKPDPAMETRSKAGLSTRSELDVESRVNKFDCNSNPEKKIEQPIKTSTISTISCRPPVIIPSTSSAPRDNVDIIQQSADISTADKPSSFPTQSNFGVNQLNHSPSHLNAVSIQHGNMSIPTLNTSQTNIPPDSESIETPQTKSSYFPTQSSSCPTHSSSAPTQVNSVSNQLNVVPNNSNSIKFSSQHDTHSIPSLSTSCLNPLNSQFVKNPPNDASQPKAVKNGVFEPSDRTESHANSENIGTDESSDSRVSESEISDDDEFDPDSIAAELAQLESEIRQEQNERTFPVGQKEAANVSGELLKENRSDVSSQRQLLPVETELQADESAARLEYNIHLQNASLRAEWARHERDTEMVSEEMREDAKRLLELFGIPYITAPAEAEAQCAALDCLGLVDGVITDDSDVFLFGASRVYKNMFHGGKFVERYLNKELEARLGLSREKLVQLAMLLGSDYTEGVKGIGIVNGMEILGTFGHHGKSTLSEFRKWLYSADETLKRPKKPKKAEMKMNSKRREYEQALFKYKHRRIRHKWFVGVNFPEEDVIQAYWKPNVDDTDEKCQWSDPDFSAIGNLCSRRLGWSETKVRDTLNPIELAVRNRVPQARIESFFHLEERNDLHKSTRIKRAINAITLRFQKDEDSIKEGEPKLSESEPTDIEPASKSGSPKRVKSRKRKKHSKSTSSKSLESKKSSKPRQKRAKRRKRSGSKSPNSNESHEKMSKTKNNQKSVESGNDLKRKLPKKRKISGSKRQNAVETLETSRKSSGKSVRKRKTPKSNEADIPVVKRRRSARLNTSKNE